MERDSFVFYKSFYKAIYKLKPEDQSLCLKALCDYCFNKEEPKDDNSIVSMFFELVKPQIDKNNQRYENGKKGGRPKPNNNQTITKPNQVITKLNQTITKVKPNDNVNDNVNVNVNDNVNVNTNRVPKAQFRKPTKQEITDFAIENKLKLDAIDDFVDYYEGNGWKIGRNPMKDWKATFRRWCRSQFRVTKTDQIEEILQAGRE